MVKKNLTIIDKKIQKIKEKLSVIGDMRPGALTKQFPKNGKKGYYQISYTYQMKSKTEYVKPDMVIKIKKEISEYKKFKDLVQQWIDLAIEKSKLEKSQI